MLLTKVRGRPFHQSGWSRSFNDIGQDYTIDKVIDSEVKHIIEATDTFFISSRSQKMDNINCGLDASHRGGPNGFVTVKNNKIYFPDYSGNNFFNTLGNIESDGRVGLLFIDFITGNVVLISGNAQILWNDSASTVIPQRI